VYVPPAASFESVLPEPEEQAVPATATMVDRETAARSRLEELYMAGPWFRAHVCRGRCDRGERAHRTATVRGRVLGVCVEREGGTNG
jgi:hypothetical protein